MNILVAFSIFTSILCLILGYGVINLIKKTEKYEDVVQDQVKYLQSISNIIADAKTYLKTLDEKGVFESDDEVGEYFRQMKKVQEELDKYMLPENYGKEEEQS